MKKILITRKLLKENEEKLKELFEVILNPDDKIYSQDELIKKSKDCDGILSSVSDQINKDTISKLKLLRRRWKRIKTKFSQFLIYNL